MCGKHNTYGFVNIISHCDAKADRNEMNINRVYVEYKRAHMAHTPVPNASNWMFQHTLLHRIGK